MIFTLYYFFEIKINFRGLLFFCSYVPYCSSDVWSGNSSKHETGSKYDIRRGRVGTKRGRVEGCSEVNRCDLTLKWRRHSGVT